MAEDGRKQAFGIGPGQRVGIGVANARGLDFHQRFASARAVQTHRFDSQRFAGGGCDGGFSFHGDSSDDCFERIGYSANSARFKPDAWPPATRCRFSALEARLGVDQYGPHRVAPNVVAGVVHVQFVGDEYAGARFAAVVQHRRGNIDERRGGVRFGAAG